MVSVGTHKNQGSRDAGSASSKAAYHHAWLRSRVAPCGCCRRSQSKVQGNRFGRPRAGSMRTQHPPSPLPGPFKQTCTWRTMPACGLLCCCAANWRSAAPQYVCRGTRHPPALFFYSSCSRVPSFKATAATGAGAASWCNPPAGSSSVACTPAIVLPLATCTLVAVSAWMRLHVWRARLSSTKYPAVSRRHGVGISD